MKILGLTGGIGSGKSVVAELLQILGVPVYDSDTRAKTLCDTDNYLKESLKNLIGSNLFSDGKMNREVLANQIFNDEKKLKEVNALIHPVVKRDFELWVLTHTSYSMVVQETAILFEAGLEKRFDKILCVTAPEDLRIERVCKRSGLTPEEVRERMEHQIKDNERIIKSDFVILNDGLHAIIPQVRGIVQVLSQETKTSN